MRSSSLAPAAGRSSGFQAEGSRKKGTAAVSSPVGPPPEAHPPGTLQQKERDNLEWRSVGMWTYTFVGEGRAVRNVVLAVLDFQGFGV